MSRPSNLPGQNTTRADRVVFTCGIVASGLLLLAIIGVFGWLIMQELTK